ncbi:alpha-methylacyl-CoA racemase [Burkholderiales bacterium]|jgi:crotonobetainyl-CoA:carnitine CoA-transferase CaiB-like acyl-CoA transferase|nr:alpha-methylacyl-CoA racemase [Burkholderiales bacterium]
MMALSGIRVLDLTRLLPGGFYGQLFADLGADVIKVEDTGAGDYMRWSEPRYDGSDDGVRSAAFLWLNRGKRSIRIDLKSEDGRKVLFDLVRTADVLVESFRPGVLDRLGIGYAKLAAIEPRLVVCSISGYGQGETHRERSGHDINYLALSGLSALSGAAGGPPTASAGQFADIGVALVGAFATLAALRERERSGLGQHVDVSLFDASVLWLGLLVAKHLCDGEPVRRGITERAVCYRLYACADGHVSLAALEPKFWATFCRGVGREDLIPRAFDSEGSDTHRELERIFASRTRAQWQAFAGENDCCLEPVLELEEALASPLVRERGLVASLEQPGVSRVVRHLAAPLRLSRTPAATGAPAPGLGANTREILSSLGRTQEEIEMLEKSGAVAGPHREGVRGSFLS